MSNSRRWSDSHFIIRICMAQATCKRFRNAAEGGIDYKTAQGKQTAWLVPQTQGSKPQRLWVFFAGNGSLALDLEPVARAAKFDTDAFLFVDYPGYGGLCSGKPSPRSIRENVKESISAAARQTGIDSRTLPDKVLRVRALVGLHAALLAVEEFHLRSAVLCAPFTSTAEMVRIRLGIPKTFPFQHAFDNRPGTAAAEEDAGPWKRASLKTIAVPGWRPRGYGIRAASKL